MEPAACSLSRFQNEQRIEQRIEPKLMDLLCALAGARGRVLSREQLLAAVWAGSVVGDDALARAVFKLRAALGDDSKSPRYIETIAKRGYRLRAEMLDLEPSESARASSVEAARAQGGQRGPILLVAAGFALLMALWWWTSESEPQAAGSGPASQALALEPLRTRAETFYFRFKRGDNEAAIELYQRVLGQQPEDVAALAGLANALTQRVIRWPAHAGAPEAGFTQLSQALAHGHLQQSPARELLQRAQALAERALARDSNSAAAHKALGLVLSARGQFEPARRSFERALALDPDHWSAQLNIADSLQIEGRAAEALPWFERAYAGMERAYLRNPEQVQIWQPRLAQVIAEHYRAAGSAVDAEAWYRRALQVAPTDIEATRGLASLLSEQGDPASGQRLCSQLGQKLGLPAPCADPSLPADPARVRQR